MTGEFPPGQFDARNKDDLQRLRESPSGVPEGQYEAWANPEIKVPRANILKTWSGAIDAAIGVGGSDEANAQTVRQVTQAITAAVTKLGGPQEYFSLEGYGDFERRLFRKQHLEAFKHEFPVAAPYLENLRKLVHAQLRLDFQPEVLSSIDTFLKDPISGSYPTDWSPNFFKRHLDPQARSLHTWIRNHVQGFDGRPDWALVLERLPAEATVGFSIRERGTPIADHDVLPLLQQTLDEIIATHGYWSPVLVSYQWKTLSEKLRKLYRTPANRPDQGDTSEQASRPNWHEILTRLPEKYRGAFHWYFGREMRYRTEQDAVQEIADILTQWQPKTWGPRWLDENGFSAIRQFWVNHFRVGDKIDWQRLVVQLPENLQEGFQANLS